MLASNYAIKRDFRAYIRFKFYTGRVSPLFWLLELMKILALLFFTFATLFSCSAHAGYYCGNEVARSATDDKGRKVELVINFDALRRTKSWSPGDGEPPLSISNAVKIAKVWAKAHYTAYDEVRIEEIALTRYGCYDVNNKWYYRFDFMPFRKGSGVRQPGQWAAVLMDGTVINVTRQK